MAIQFTVRCDGCGRIIATSSSSARAARAEAVMRKANHGPDGDQCEACRLKRNRERAEQLRTNPAPKTHSIGPGHPTS